MSRGDTSVINTYVIPQDTCSTGDIQQYNSTIFQSAQLTPILDMIWASKELERSSNPISSLDRKKNYDLETALLDGIVGTNLCLCSSSQQNLCTWKSRLGALDNTHTCHIKHLSPRGCIPEDRTKCFR